MAMSGKAGTMKLRGRVDAGFEAPARARLEGIAPFGKPVFVLVADGGRGTLVLPREDRVLRDAPPEQIVEALAGVPARARGAADGSQRLRPRGRGRRRDGRTFPNGWTAVTLPDGTDYLRRNARSLGSRRRHRAAR